MIAATNFSRASWISIPRDMPQRGQLHDEKRQVKIGGVQEISFMSAASLIANHMNVPYGKIVSEEDVAASFRYGKLSASSLEANAILAPFFNEIEPSLIIRCARELGVSLQTANALYEDTLTRGYCESPAWKKAIWPCA